MLAISLRKLTKAKFMRIRENFTAIAFSLEKYKPLGHA